jgi:ketosteroid isomerase-like protein
MIATQPKHPALALGLVIFAALGQPAISEELIMDDVLASFRPVTGWNGVAKAEVVSGETALRVEGQGKLLVNGTAKDKSISYLITREEFGDIRIELEFMVPKNSNSGVYVMGRYEVQIFDSFGREKFGSGDLGGIYERARPDKQCFEGMAPKTNAAKAPGEWQILDVTFRAPRFDHAGAKTRDATFEKVLVNGVLVQENATTSGPTRSSPLEGETTLGPIAIQGDHGPIVIRSFRVTPLLDEEQVRLKELDAYWAEVSRAVNQGDFEAYNATCHPEAVLIAESKNLSQPLAVALKRWRKDFDNARNGKVDPTVEFRFSKRFGDATTAREIGMFRYTSRMPDGTTASECVHLDALLVKRDGAWKILVENQTSTGTEVEWDALMK